MNGTSLPRTSGILLHPTSLPSPYGIGDLGRSAYEFVDFLAQAGQHLWQVLPLTHTGFGDSPYQSFSAFAGQPLLISPAYLQELQLVSQDDLNSCPQGDPTQVDYGAVIPWKNGLLRKAFQSFQEGRASHLNWDFENFCREQDAWLSDYSLFMAMKDCHEGRCWLDWPEDCRRPDPDKKAALRAELTNESRFYAFVQFLFFREWMELKRYANEKGVRIIGDIPIFVSMDSADVWGNQHLFPGFFSVAIILALGFMGNMVQSNSIGVAFNNAFHVPTIAVGIFVAIVAAIIFIGGINRIASFTEKIVPIMALLYVLGSLIILVTHLPGVGTALKDIFVGAFSPQSVAGGMLGVTVQKAMRFGVARGLFSNEAGMGSTPHAHATAKVANPCEQGIIAMMGVFIDTFIILTMTALVILSTGVLGNGQTGAELAQSAFNVGFGDFGNIFIAICMLFFAFTTIIGWYYFGEVNVRHLFGNKAVKVYAVIVVIFVIIGSTLKVDLVWNMADMFNGLMVLPNLIALLACMKVVTSISKEHKAL